jgi:hypothetical protein
MTLFVTGDIFAQLAIEQRQLGLEDRIRDAWVIKDRRNLYDVRCTQSYSILWADNLACSNDTDGIMLVMLNLKVGAAALLTADGIIFAPLGHVWLQTMSRISFPSTLKSKSRQAQYQTEQISQ